MISLEKTRQDLKSLNLTTIILNFIFAGFSLLGLIGIILLMVMMNNPEVQSSITAETDAAQLQAVQGVLGIFGIVVLAIATLCPLIVAILAILNRKKIDANQPSLTPYYFGGGTAAILLLLSLFNGSLSFLDLAIQGGLLVLYYFAIKKSKDLINFSQSNN